MHPLNFHCLRQCHGLYVLVKAPLHSNWNFLPQRELAFHTYWQLKSPAIDLTMITLFGATQKRSCRKKFLNFTLRRKIHVCDFTSSEIFVFPPLNRVYFPSTSFSAPYLPFYPSNLHSLLSMYLSIFFFMEK